MNQATAFIDLIVELEGSVWISLRSILGIRGSLC